MLMLTEQKMTKREAALLNPLQLAYIGDAVWSLLVRQQLVLKRYNVHHMHLESVSRVNANAQAAFMKEIEPLLTGEEAEIAQRGRNSHARHPAPRNQDPADYAEATAFEALIGYLYVSDQMERLGSLLDRFLDIGGTG